MNIVREKIHKIEFRMLSPKFVKKMAVVKIITPELYDADGYPVDGGLMDIRMGVIDPGLRCRSCGSRVKECPGHFGFIELARPVLHTKYIPQIGNFLKCTCDKCSKILLSEEAVSKYRKRLIRIEKNKGVLEKWKAVEAIIKKCKNITKCPHCSTKQKKVKLDKPSTFYEESIKLTPIDIRERLERIPDDNLELLGFEPQAGRPEWMILTLLPVPPVTVRPNITLESGQRSEDDLTHKLGDIVRTNQRLFENLSAGAPQLIIDDLWDLLQYHITTFFVNNISQIPPARHSSGRPLKTLEERIKSKEGRFRRNLAGKRVDFSSRTVISPDSHIRPDEVGVPNIIARELTVPERVTEWNKKYLLELVKNGPDNYPGANYVITPEGKRKRIMDETKESILKEIEPGYSVERHIVDGDIAIFNRQPSLHKMSMMGHFIKVLPYKTFRINPCTTTPYNADFDGDEMNLHLPQTEEAIAEVRILMGVSEQIITPRYGLPIIGANEDHISGCFILTQDDTFVTKKQLAHVMSLIGYDKDLPDSKDGIYSGKQVFSMLLPSDFNYEGKSRKCLKHNECMNEKCEHDSYVSIKNGKLKCGVIDKNAIGAGGGRLFNSYLKQYGSKRAMIFLQEIAMLG
ncbi:MAG: DNA-directed RNA polymerase subunit A', partial [Candidatus Thorarchaeota archaeon]